MVPKPQVVILLLPFLFLSSSMAFNITAILEPFPKFTIFNNYLNQTKLVNEINHRQTITILIVDNSKISAISFLPEESLKHVMEVHVILGYYDIRKISRIPRKSFLITILFQTIGVATKRMGFLNVTHKASESVVFGSAILGAPHTSILIKKVMTMPYNISILQISEPIIPPRIDGTPCIASISASSEMTDPSEEAPEPQVVILLLPFLFLSSSMAFNITAILEPFPKFTIFNNYLNQTKLVNEINHRQTITILIVDNSKISAISFLPEESLKHVMEVHVILGYYDIRKISRIPRKSFLITILFQTIGVATKRMGFLNVTHKASESVVFGSAILGAPHTSILIKKVMTMPYNISILQISEPIIPPRIDGTPCIASISASSEMTDPSEEAPEVAEALIESSEEDVVDAPTDALGESVNAPADFPEADQLTLDASEEPSSSHKKVFDASTSTTLRGQLPISTILELVMISIFVRAF
ncbi:putative fasciclin-like arabinogalactan protein 3 [Cocos nucifera]|uniref:Putative fasciclin-like arabinogalactan protein 3 n=1 Tax=Cocos nucifera TaxID=13894 RepID=A0A8K0NDJ7_COCNU|nr:putative fasciclin-like arabinogalactan protein 3 [Cocos nucifera]